MLNFAQVSNRSIGTITFDVVTTEDHQSDLSITENPIESGLPLLTMQLFSLNKLPLMV
ncbi:hypothetical protein [Haemophilus parainfluenzae]|uniref:hypothetical protein n=1 Tax=Haemophilus parainfluenzae TaxID=729 RepID=UPI0021C6B4E8